MIAQSQLEPTKSEQEVAVAILQERLGDRERRSLLRSIQSQPNSHKTVEWIVAQAEGSAGTSRTRLPASETARFLVDLLGSELLSEFEVRKALLSNCEPQILDDLSERVSGTRRNASRSKRVATIASRPWYAGKGWARYFARKLGFPIVFGGLQGTNKEPDTMEVETFSPLPELYPFQNELVLHLRGILNESVGFNRAVLSLPTGAGKTRTAIEALLDWYLAQNPRRSILWIAQSEELCEQAVQAFKEVWVDFGHRGCAANRETLSIGRYWGSGRKLSTTGVIVASIQKLVKLVQRLDGGNGGKKNMGYLVEDLARGIGVIVVDEAHRTTAQSYSQVLSAFGVHIRGSDTSNIPLIGLTATPYRGQIEETASLVKCFHGRLLVPASLGTNPIEMLREQGVLSYVKHKVVEMRETAYEVMATQKYREYHETFGDFHPELLRFIGEDEHRNTKLLEIVEAVPVECPTLFFACTVQHAVAMSLLLRRRGRSAGVVVANTRAAVRRQRIAQFREGQISVLCNFGVLTTGFDAPKVGAVVIARPTVSPVLYEQMIGRGMRGPAFGGTEHCQVVDVVDNLKFDGQLAYVRFKDYWS